MSVNCVIHESTDEQIAEMIQSPEKIHDFLRWDPPQQSWWDKFLGRKLQLPPDYELPFLDLGKSWEGIHYVLAGTKEKISSPRSFLVSGGRYIGDEDVGYGPARSLTSDMVMKVNRSLIKISPEEFSARIDLHRMQSLQVYGAPFPGEADMLKYFIEDYISLREYISKLSNRHRGVVIQYV